MFESQKVRRHEKFRKEWSQTLEQMQVPNGIGPGVMFNFFAGLFVAKCHSRLYPISRLIDIYTLSCVRPRA